MKLYSQVFTAIVGIIGVFASIVLGGKNPFDFQVLLAVLPSIIFISIGINVATVVEAMDFLVFKGAPNESSDKRELLHMLLTAVAFLLASFVIFSRSVTNAAIGDFKIDGITVSCSAFMIVISLLIYGKVSICVSKR